MALTKSDLTEIGNVIEVKLEPIKKDLGTLKKDVKYVKKTVDIIAKNYDQADVNLARRVAKIENHLRISDN